MGTRPTLLIVLLTYRLTAKFDKSFDINYKNMKKALYLLALLFSGIVTQAQTVEEVVNRFIEASGGLERLKAINSIQIESTLNMAQFGTQPEIHVIRVKDRFFRIQSGSPMGGDDSYTLINDTVGYVFTPAMRGPGGGMEASLTKMTQEEVAAQAYQKDSHGYFGPLVDYAAKGHTAVLSGKQKIGDYECDKVTLTLKTGQEFTYFIAPNGQIKRVQMPALVALESMGMSTMAKMFANRKRDADRKIEINYDKYKIFEGYPMPTKQTVSLGMFSIEINHYAFSFNQPVDAKWAKVTGPSKTNDNQSDFQDGTPPPPPGGRF